MVAATIVVGLAGVSLRWAGYDTATAWLVGGYSLAVAAWQAWSMIRDLLRGSFGLDVLAVTAITATVLVGDHWAALIVVLMLTGGEALEDYANARAHREISALLERAPRTAQRSTGDGDHVVAQVEPPGRFVGDVEDDLAIANVLLRDAGARVDGHRDIGREAVVGAPVVHGADQVRFGRRQIQVYSCET